MMMGIRTLQAPRPYTIQNTYVAVYDTCSDILGSLQLLCDPDSLNMLPYREMVVDKNGLRALFPSACHYQYVGSAAYR
jgi:hypothetical protein